MGGQSSSQGSSLETVTKDNRRQSCLSVKGAKYRTEHRDMQLSKRSTSGIASKRDWVSGRTSKSSGNMADVNRRPPRKKRTGSCRVNITAEECQVHKADPVSKIRLSVPLFSDTCCTSKVTQGLTNNVMADIGLPCKERSAKPRSFVEKLRRRLSPHRQAAELHDPEVTSRVDPEGEQQEEETRNRVPVHKMLQELLSLDTHTRYDEEHTQTRRCRHAEAWTAFLEQHERRELARESAKKTARLDRKSKHYRKYAEGLKSIVGRRQEPTKKRRVNVGSNKKVLTKKLSHVSENSVATSKEVKVCYSVEEKCYRRSSMRSKPEEVSRVKRAYAVVRRTEYVSDGDADTRAGFRPCPPDKVGLSGNGDSRGDHNKRMSSRNDGLDAESGVMARTNSCDRLTFREETNVSSGREAHLNKEFHHYRQVPIASADRHSRNHLAEREAGKDVFMELQEIVKQKSAYEDPKGVKMTHRRKLSRPHLSDKVAMLSNKPRLLQRSQSAHSTFYIPPPPPMAVEFMTTHHRGVSPPPSSVRTASVTGQSNFTKAIRFLHAQINPPDAVDLFRFPSSHKSISADIRLKNMSKEKARAQDGVKARGKSTVKTDKSLGKNLRQAVKINKGIIENFEHAFSKAHVGKVKNPPAELSRGPRLAHSRVENFENEYTTTMRHKPRDICGGVCSLCGTLRKTFRTSSPSPRGTSPGHACCSLCGSALDKGLQATLRDQTPRSTRVDDADRRSAATPGERVRRRGAEQRSRSRPAAGGAAQEVAAGTGTTLRDASFSESSFGSSKVKTVGKLTRMFEKKIVDFQTGIDRELRSPRRLHQRRYQYQRQPRGIPLMAPFLKPPLHNTTSRGRQHESGYFAREEPLSIVRAPRNEMEHLQSREGYWEDRLEGGDRRYASVSFAREEPVPMVQAPRNEMEHLQPREGYWEDRLEGGERRYAGMDSRPSRSSVRIDEGTSCGKPGCFCHAMRQQVQPEQTIKGILKQPQRPQTVSGGPTRRKHRFSNMTDQRPPLQVILEEDGGHWEGAGVALSSNVKSTSPRVALSSNVKSTSPRVALSSNVQSTSPRVALPSYVKSTSPRVTLPSRVQSTSPRVAEAVKVNQPKQETLGPLKSCLKKRKRISELH